MRNIYLVQVNWSDCAGNAPGYWIPYSVGSLWAYARSVPEIAAHYELRDIVFDRQPIAATAQAFEQPDVVGFSTYVWNEQYNLRLAEAVRARWPDALIVFGGPQVPSRNDGFFERHSFIDLLVHSEGEETFSRILLERLLDAPRYENVPGCSVNREGRTIRTPPAPRLKQLSQLPSAYLTGVFDAIMDAHPDAHWNAVLENNRGCPYQCTFCDWATLTYSKVEQFPLQRVLDEIEWLGRRRVSYIMPADANFGLFHDRDMQIARALVDSRERCGYPLVVGMAFAKNSNRRVLQIAKLLHQAGLLKAATLSTQSMSEPVLEAIKRRNMAINDLAALLGECNREGVPTYTELILGLPEETLRSWKEGLCQALECGQHHQLESWLLEILENAPINDPESLSRYGIKTKRLRNYTFVSDKKDCEEAPEEIAIVYESASMPFADFQLALGFSSIIHNLHSYGWTQFIARFLHDVHGVPYMAFYTRLESWIGEHNDTVVAREYQKTIETLQTMIATGEYVVDRFLLGKNIGSVPIGLRSQGFFHIDADATRDAIEDFAAAEFGMLLGDEIDDVFRFQRHFVTSPDRRYPYEEQFSADYAALLYGDAIARQSTVYRFDTLFSFDSLESYVSLIYSKKKQGFGKAKITDIAHVDVAPPPQSPVEPRAGYGAVR